jgi:hypothetical protein
LVGRHRGWRGFATGGFPRFGVALFESFSHLGNFSIVFTSLLFTPLFLGRFGLE